MNATERDLDLVAKLGAEIERLIAEGAPVPDRRDDPDRMSAAWDARIDVLEEALSQLRAESLQGALAHGRAFVRTWSVDGPEGTLYDRHARLERLMMSVVNYLEAAVLAAGIGDRLPAAGPGRPKSTAGREEA